MLALFIIVVIFSLTTLSFAQAEKPEIPTPTGARALLVILPIILILVLIFLKVNMLIAGLAGGVLAMLIGGISLARANSLFLESIPSMLSFTGPIVNSAIAMAVYKSGGYASSLALVRRGIKGRVEILAAFIVLLMSVATYMSGIGGGTAMVLAPLAFAAVGAIPEVIAGMSIVAAAAFTTSPASLESSVVAQLTGSGVNDYVIMMRPYWLLFTVLAVVLAYWGTKRRKALFTGEEPEEIRQMTTTELWKTTIPAIFLLLSVLVGPYINRAAGIPILGPLVYATITITLIGLLTKFSFGQSADAMVDGSTYILTRLFQVGVFLTFINMIGETGAFNSIVSVIQGVPVFWAVPLGILAGFAIGVPAGAYVGSILALVLPVAISLGLPLLHIGFITMGVGFGSQMSVVNITMQAQSSGFQIPIMQVVRGNTKWVLSSMAILLLISILVQMF